jgi:hypothetical protein
MSTISLHTQNFHTGSISSLSAAPAASDSGMARISSGLPGFDGSNGAAALSIGHPGFGARATGRFNIGDFLG